MQVCSLEALAFGAAPLVESGEVIISALDARRGEVFWAAYQVDETDLAEVISGQRRHIPGLTKQPGEKGFDSRLEFLVLPRLDTPKGRADVIFSPDGLLDYTAGCLVHVGNGNASPEDPMPAELLYPSPGAVALLGREQALAGAAVAPEAAEPVYLRPPDASPPSGDRFVRP